MPAPKFTDVCSKRNFIRKAQDNGWVTKQDESALSAIYDAASKEEPDEMKADLMHDAIADIFLNDVHDPKDRKSAIDRLLDRLAEAIFGKELREKVQRLDQGTITPQQMKENYERIYGQRNATAAKESKAKSDLVESLPTEWKQVMKNPSAMEKTRREVFDWIQDFKADVAKNGHYTKGNPYGFELRNGQLVSTKGKLPWRDITEKELVEKETRLGHLKPEKAKVVRKKKLSGPAAQADKEIELTNLETPVLMSEEALKKNPILGGPRLM